MIIPFLSYISLSLFYSSSMLPRYLRASDMYKISGGHDDVCTWIVTIHYISDGLQLLHAFMLSLLLYKFRKYIVMLYRDDMATFCNYGLPFLIPVDDLICVRLLPSHFLSFVSMLDLITSLMDSILSIFPTFTVTKVPNPIFFLSHFVLFLLFLIVLTGKLLVGLDGGEGVRNWGGD